MKCPQCGHGIEPYSTKLRRRRRLKLECVDCAVPLSSRDKYRHHIRCVRCRRRAADLARARRNVAHTPTDSGPATSNPQ